MTATARTRPRPQRPAPGQAWQVIVLGLALLLPAGLHAQDSGLAHTVQPGDTLSTLALDYLGDARSWPALQRSNQVRDPRRLRPGTVLHIPAHLLPASTARVLFASGDVRLQAAGGSAVQLPDAGQLVAEGARLQAGPQSFVSVELADGTVVRVQADSQVQIEQLRRRGRAGDAQSVLELQRGSVESSVPPQPGSQRRFEVRTPGATTAVRGTRFAVTLAPDGRTLAAVTEGRLAVTPAAQARPAIAVASGQGLVVSADGQATASQNLLPAPGLEALPDTLGDADFLRLPLEPVPGAVAYRVQLARDAQFASVMRSTYSSSPLVQLATLPDGHYHLAARAIDAQGLPGLPAQRAITIKAHPIAPLLQVSGTALALPGGELSCTPVDGAAAYRIQVAAAADFAAPVLDVADSEHCRLALTALPPGAYHWRAASVRRLPDGQMDQGPFSPAQAFTLAKLPAAPTGDAIAVQQAGSRLQLNWPGQPGERFELQLSPEPDFATLALEQELSEPSWTAPAMAPGRYYLRIRTRNAETGLISSFSTPRRITLQPVAAVRSSTGLPVTSADGQPLSRP